MQQIPGQCLVHFGIILTNCLNCSRGTGVSMNAAFFAGLIKQQDFGENGWVDKISENQ